MTDSRPCRSRGECRVDAGEDRAAPEKLNGLLAQFHLLADVEAARYSHFSMRAFFSLTKTHLSRSTFHDCSCTKQVEFPFALRVSM